MSKHKFSRDADLHPSTAPKPRRDQKARAAIVAQHRAGRVVCTAINCPKTAQLIEAAIEARKDNRPLDAEKISAGIGKHERGKGCEL